MCFPDGSVFLVFTAPIIALFSRNRKHSNERKYGEEIATVSLNTSEYMLTYFHAFE